MLYLRMNDLHLEIMNLLVVQICIDVPIFKKGRRTKGGYSSIKDPTWNALDVQI